MEKSPHFAVYLSPNGGDSPATGPLGQGLDSVPKSGTSLEMTVKTKTPTDKVIGGQKHISKMVKSAAESFLICHHFSSLVFSILEFMAAPKQGQPK